MKENQMVVDEQSIGAATPRPANVPERVLVVEDDADLRHLNVEVLRSAGYEVDGAEDGAAAWQALNNQSYDLMITDQNMPKLSGLELLKKLHAARMEMPVIMASGTTPTAEFTRYPWLQPAAMLVKPYLLADLLQAVRQTLGEVNRLAAGSQLFMYQESPATRTLTGVAAIALLPQQPQKVARRILVVDEDQDLRVLYAAALTGAGYQVDFAADGVSAWEALQATRYDLLITEHAMPKLTGVELVRKLRAARMALPVVMASGRMLPHELTQIPTLQLAAVLSKPFTIDLLLETVAEVLQATRAPGRTKPTVEKRRSAPQAIAVS